MAAVSIHHGEVSTGLCYVIHKKYRIEGYLLGTVHFVDPETAKLPPHLKEKIKISDYFFMEAKMGLKDWARTKLCKKYKQTNSIFQKRKKWFSKELGYSVYLDQKIMEVALNEGIAIKGLESFRDQVDLLCNLEMNKSDFKELKDIPITWAKIWKEGDEKSAEEQTVRVRELLGSSSENSIDSRNLKWLPQIEEALNSKKLPFFSVGAAHLYGGKGLLQLLREKGWRILQYDRSGKLIFPKKTLNSC